MNRKETASSVDNGAANLEALSRFRNLFTLPAGEARAIIGDHGLRYFAEYFSGRVSPDVYVEKARLLMRHTNAAGRSLLDVGCGHGFLVVLAAALGARRSVGIEIHGGKIAEAKRLAEYMGVSGTEFLTYDGGILPFSEGEFDAVSIAAALSHVRDIDAVLKEMHRVLRPGGKVWVFEDNNAMHWQYKKRIHPVWAYAETGEGLVSHATAKKSDGWVPFRERRRKMIAEWFPELSTNRVLEYAAATQGLVLDEIREAVQHSLDSGSPVVVDKYFRIYSPTTGEALEYPFTPPMLRRWVAKYFDSVEVKSAVTRPYVGIKGILRIGSKLIGGLVRPVMYKTQAVYIVVGTKRESGGTG